MHPIFDILYLLECPEHDLAIFEKYLYLCNENFCGKCNPKTNAQDFIKFYI